VRDAFGIEHADLVSKVSLTWLRPAAKAAGRGPGAQLTRGAKVGAVPRKTVPYGGYTEYDPIKAAQITRGAMKASFR